MDGVVKADRLLVQSVSNFVDDKSAAAGTITRNLVGSNLENKDNLLLGIRVDSALRPPSGNGLPGDLADRTLAVVATDVSVVGKDGQLTAVTGNSFATPAIAGAAALLKQYWPQLGGNEQAREFGKCMVPDGAVSLTRTALHMMHLGLLGRQPSLQGSATPAARRSVGSDRSGGR